MVLMFCSGLFGKFSDLKDTIDSYNGKIENFFIAGNLGIEDGNDEAINLIVQNNINFITGKYENFGLIKELESYHIKPKGIEIKGVKISGVSGTYSPRFYPIVGAPKRNMTRGALFSVPKNQDIVLMHNIPGKLAKNNTLDFDDEFFSFIEDKTPRFIFVGGYDRFSHFQHPCGTTVLFLVNLEKGFFTLNTDDFEIFYHKRV